jgi:hypothetical protein
MEKLSREHHCHILAAYMNRLTVSDLEAILEANKAGWHAGFNLGTAAQIEAHKTMERAVDQAVHHLSEHDINLIGKAVVSGGNAFKSVDDALENAGTVESYLKQAREIYPGDYSFQRKFLIHKREALIESSSYQQRGEMRTKVRALADLVTVAIARLDAANKFLPSNLWQTHKANEEA